MKVVPISPFVAVTLDLRPVTVTDSLVRLKKLILLFFVFVSCNSKREELRFFPEPESVSSQSFYEGRIPLDEKRVLVIELSLLPYANSAEGQYQLVEAIQDGSSSYPLPEHSGTYSSFQEGERIVVHLHNSALGDGVKRTFYAKNEKGDLRFREENLRAVDLTLLRLDDETFSVLSTTSEPVSRNANDHLYRHTSLNFTIEGYFRHTGDSADFFEMNTERRWAVTKLGVYSAAIRQYHELVQEKFQPVYLKGVGFSINRPNESGKKVEALVIKRLVQMSSVPQN